MIRRLLAVTALALVAACSGGPAGPGALLSRSPAPSPVPRSPTPAPVVFDVGRAIDDIQVLVEDIGPREAVSAGYRRAAAYVADRFADLGYRVRRQSVPIPAGTIEGVDVPAGRSDNVIAVPPDFRPDRPHIVAGAHLDSVPMSPGANDNASGPAVLLELARMARAEPTRLPIVWVAFTGEERRQPGPTGGMYGSRAYLASLAKAERAAVIEMLNVDMVGNGPVVLVSHNGTTTREFLDRMLRAARRLDEPARENIVTRYFSDHFPFEDAGIPVAWLWSGEHPTVHTPGDVVSVIRAADLSRVGRVAWEALRAGAE